MTLKMLQKNTTVLYPINFECVLSLLANNIISLNVIYLFYCKITKMHKTTFLHYNQQGSEIKICEYF